MRARAFLFLSLALFAVPASAQVFSGGVEFLSLPLGARNGVSNLHAEGDTLYLGPRLAIRTSDGEFEFVGDDTAFNPANAPDATVFSIDVEDDVIWTGLGFTDLDSDGEPQSAAGFAFSTDGGRTWTYRQPQLDSPNAETVEYGISTLPALPVIVPQQSPPFDIDYDPVTGDVWMAGWASGIRRSGDNGQTWERIVLPPDTLGSISPDVQYDFLYAPINRDAVDRQAQQNGFVGFAVLVDEAGTVWAGTAAGVSRGDRPDVPEFDDDTDDRAWTRYAFDGTPNSLPGNFVISIEEQPLGDPSQPIGSDENPRNPVWIIGWPADDPNEEHALTVWLGDDEDGEAILEPRLITGSRIFDVAFDGGIVYVAGSDGLYISEDGGQTWRTVSVFRDAEGRILPLSPDVDAFAVAVTGAGTPQSVLWLGVGDGLLRSTDGGDSWQALRADVPLSGGGSDEAPDVESYAYPNPFTPGADGFARIRVDVQGGGGTLTVRIFDFAMNLVRELEAPARGGANEALWDGLSEDGTRVANGVYFYRVEGGGVDVSGKILVLE